ncbi:GNAT family N-acetyltransferase [Dactylosporangium matsuzakiense]|uniref:GNAT family N-acetyltransferase n=1 Tax=Dactylosporangium matsuzakiense TaxID=53360 RepID=UPI0021C475B7|nr:GNAT family N-acetyltransferase [Dactylosporangium matsuzakiense]UWZ46450.1 GNAT family N-acetyltransferase [Dactylosporangium matsuzakiense]
MGISVVWRGAFGSEELSALHASAFGGPGAARDWWAQVNAHSLGWVTGRDGAELVGFVNVAWDGGEHAFVLDTMVAAAYRRGGAGARLVALAAEQARTTGCRWLHVDFEPHLTKFYVDACGFTPTPAGLISLLALP